MSNNIYKPTEQSRKQSHKYFRWYRSLVRKALVREEPNEYTEKHHIFPKSIFGPNKFLLIWTPNKLLVVLTLREHFVAHKLLSKIYTLRYGPDHIATRKMNYALGYMRTRKEIKNNSRRYEECRKAFYQARLGSKHSPESKRRMSEAGIGRKFSDETRRRISEAKQNMSDETKRRMSEAGIGRKCSDETRRKLSEVNIGKKHSDESKRRMSESHRLRQEMFFSKQEYYCVNCGNFIYAQEKWPWYPTCGKDCFNAKELKDTRSIMGKEMSEEDKIRLSKLYVL